MEKTLKFVNFETLERSRSATVISDVYITFGSKSWKLVYSWGSKQGSN